MMKLLFMMTLFRLTTVILVFGLASANWAQEPINGPWLWMFAPVAEGQPGGAQALETDQIGLGASSADSRTFCIHLCKLT